MFQIDDMKNIPIYEQVIWKIKELCLRGALKPGEKLPSVRELSGMIIANPNTVSKAYQELERQGVIEIRPGKGAFVHARPPDRADAGKQEGIREQLRRLVIEAIYAGLTLEEIKTWLEEEYAQLGGSQRA